MLVEHKNKFLDEIKLVLNFWDPFKIVDRLKAKGIVPKEYDRYAPEIFDLLLANAKILEIVEHLARIQIKDMGIKKTDKRNKVAAKILFGLQKPIKLAFRKKLSKKKRGKKTRK